MADEFPIRPKDPDSTEDFPVNWEHYLAPTGDSLESATWTVPAPLVLVRSEISGDRAIAWISGGRDGRSYVVTCRINTVQGRRNVDQSIRIKVQQR